MPRVQKFSTLLAPQGWYKAGLTLGIHKYEEPLYKIWWPIICTPADMSVFALSVFILFIRISSPFPSPPPTLLILVHVSREIRWPRRVARINKNKVVLRVLVGKHEGKRCLVGAKVDGKRSRIAGCGLDSSCLGYRPVVGFCEHGNEHAGSVKCEEKFLLISWENVSLSRTLLDGVIYVTENISVVLKNSNIGI